MSALPAVDIVDVEFAWGLPGLQPHTAFRLEPIAGAEGLAALRSVDGDVRLFVLDPPEGYRPQLDAAVLGQIGAAEASDARLFVVANPGADGVYLNLRAPIVIHRESGRGVQVILEDQGYPIRMLLGA